MAFDSFHRALGPPEVRVGGRLQAFLPAWAAITDDAFMLSVIRGGFSIEIAGATCLRAWSWCSLVVVEEDGVQAVTGGDVMGSVWQAYCEKLLARFGSIFREIA